uniref:Uncharacterized protein n=1 Tax=Myotis myotis TaxID=51298 RepID=A0A7J7SCA0_MYOMY|nr:hypothetical protein mMyoMyo1_009535 [Myotis myotis]
MLMVKTSCYSKVPNESLSPPTGTGIQKRGDHGEVWHVPSSLFPLHLLTFQNDSDFYFYRNVIRLYILFLQLTFLLNCEFLLRAHMDLPHPFSCLQSFPLCEVPQRKPLLTDRLLSVLLPVSIAVMNTFAHTFFLHSMYVCEINS